MVLARIGKMSCEPATSLAGKYRETTMTTSRLPDEYRAIADAWTTAAQAIARQLISHSVVFLAADGGGWVDAGVTVSAGQQVTLLPFGKVWLSREADLAFGPNIALWYRAGGGLIARSVANSVTFEAEDAGLLRLIAKPPGEWANRHGDFLPEYPHVGATGGLLVAVLVWSDSVDDGLSAFAAKDSTGIAAAELQRRASHKPLPPGWEPLWRLGATSVFSQEVDQHGRAVIACRCANDAGILKYPLDVVIDDTTRLDWSWRVTRLPSRFGEDTLATHDYLSIAIEFDNGQDMTYLWSSSLPVGASFRCPIPWWDQRETHIVRRSGTSELGIWVDESQPILEDCSRAIAPPPPRRIVGLWLLGVSPFQRTVGECEFRSIQLKSKTANIWIGP